MPRVTLRAWLIAALLGTQMMPAMAFDAARGFTNPAAPGDGAKSLTVIGCPSSDGSATIRDCVLDGNGAAFTGVVAITPGTPVAAGRSVGFVCTAAGNITLTMADASTITLPIMASASFQTLPFAATNLVLGSGTAGSFWNLK